MADILIPYLQERGQRIREVAFTHTIYEDSCPTIAVVIGKGVPRSALRVMGARRIGDVVEMPTSEIARISEIDSNFGAWARRDDGRIRVFYIERFSTLLINIAVTEDGVLVSLEPGSTDEERQAVAS